MTHFKYILSFILLLSIVATATATDPTWLDNDAIEAGLDDVGTKSAPSVFQYENNWYIIVGDESPTDNNPPQLNGSIWNATTQQWDANAAIVNNLLSDLGLNYDITASVFVNDTGVLSGVFGMQGMLRFHQYNGSAWNRVVAFETGWSYGAYNNPAVFYNLTSTLCLLNGLDTGVIEGFSWNGTSWNPDSYVNDSLPDTGDHAAPSVINAGDALYLLVGDQDGTTVGFISTGGAWSSDSDIITGLTDVGTYSHPAPFDASGHLSLIVGEGDGVFNGYYYESREPSTPFLSSPVNGSQYTEKTITLTTTGFNASGLVAWWKFENDYTDETGVNDGTPSGTTGYTFGINGNSSNYDGSSGYLDCGNDASLDVKNFTISLWVKTTDQNQRDIIVKGSGGDRYLLRLHSNGMPFIQIYDSVLDAYRYGNVALDNGLWHHVVAVVDNDGNTINMYTDGALSNGGANLRTIGDISSSVDLYIAKGVYSGGYFNGILDEVMIFNRAISADEVSQIYAYGREEAETLTFSFYGDMIDASTSLGSSTTGELSWQIPVTGTQLWKVRSYDTNYYSDYSSVNYFYTLFAPNLSNPTNTSTQYFDYPPMFDDVSFNWENIAAPAYQLQVAEDINFNLIASDTVVSLPSDSISLDADEYFWRVRSYNSTTSVYSDWSSTFTFDLVANGTVENNTVQGVVYENIAGVYTALDNAKVVIWNSTFSDSMTTGSNGYYLFTGLATGETYYLQASKDLYLTSEEVIINATVTPITKNFYLLPDRTSEEWRHYTKFIVTTIWGTRYPGVTVTVYENGDVTALYTGETGADGSITFVMNRQTQYRITFVNSTLGINEQRYIYPKDDVYYIIVSSSLGSWDTYDTPLADAIDFDISQSTINSSSAYVNVSYVDTSNGTQSLFVYLNTTNSSDILNQTVVDTWNAGATNNSSHSFIVSGYGGQGYFIHLLVTHDDYGTIDSVYSVGFDDDIALQFPNIPASVWLYGAVFMLVFSAGVFTVTTVPQGMLIITIENFVFYGLGCYNSLPDSVRTSILAGTILAFILSIIANLNESSKKEGYK